MGLEGVSCVGGRGEGYVQERGEAGGVEAVHVDGVLDVGGDAYSVS